MSAPLPPPRSLLYVKPIVTEAGAGLELACDCGIVTQLIIADTGQLAELLEVYEFAVTCDGCTSVHWFTISPPQEVTTDG